MYEIFIRGNNIKGGGDKKGGVKKWIKENIKLKH